MRASFFRYVFAVCFLAAAALHVGCSRESATAAPELSNLIAFADSGIAFDPGAGWRPFDGARSAVPPGICFPPLARKHAGIEVLLLPREHSEPQAAATVLERDAATKPLISGSLQRTNITTDSGLKLVHISYRLRPPKDESVTELRNHYYLLTNRVGRCVAIHYYSSADAFSDAVDSTIRKTLRFQ